MKITVTKTSTYNGMEYGGEQCTVTYKYRGIDGKFLIYPSYLTGRSPKRDLRRRVRFDAAIRRKRLKKGKATRKQMKRKQKAKEYLEKVSRNFPGGEFPGF